MRLIDADAYLQKLKADPLYSLIERYGVEETIEAMPTIDAEPNAETEEKTTYAFIKSTEKHTMIEGYVKNWWTENGVIGVTFVSGNTYITGANNVLIQETKE